MRFSSPTHRAPAARLALAFLLLGLALLGACRASGPGTHARTVAAFFNKYEKRPGFHTTEWSASLLQRLALVKAANLFGGNDLTNAITGIRAARVLTFAPTSTGALDLSQQGLLSEANGLLQAEKYTSFSAGNSAGGNYNSVIKTSGDRVSELVATGSLPNAANSFVLVQVEGNFTRAQAEALSKVLPQVVQQTAQ
ncbi:MAG: DUF4252 domain-containing protein [Hymenobacter sp.]|nr:MAG: DUF4252 domain-containing protein [Hymenobacter sp.]